MTTHSADARARGGIGYVPQGREIFPHLTVIENLRMGQFVNRGKGAFALDEVYGWFPFLHDREHQRGGTLSGGQQEMLAIARALVNGPSACCCWTSPATAYSRALSKRSAPLSASSSPGDAIGILIVEQKHRSHANCRAPRLRHGQGARHRHPYARRAAGHRKGGRIPFRLTREDNMSWLERSYMMTKGVAQGKAGATHDLSEARQGKYHYVYGPYAQPSSEFNPATLWLPRPTMPLKARSSPSPI